jgi:UPF0755 protein
MSPREPGRRGSSCLFLFTVAAVGAAALTVSFFLPAGQEEDFRPVTVPPGASVGEIGDILEREGIIRSATAFQLVVRMMKKDRSLVSGEYKLSPGMSLYRVIRALEKGRVVTAPVTIPEGMTVAQIADLMSIRGFAAEQDFLDLCRQHGTSFSDISPFVASDTLEGYLFPDTYRFARGADARAIVAAMLSNYERRVVDAKLEPAGAARGYTDYQRLIMASMVEKEAKVPQDRGPIAGVLYNRLRIGMPLQCDATIQYVLAKRKERLLLDDLKVDSPYNTYQHDGLPPAPICNPGLASIRAAYDPEPNSYLYYVARADGSHIFSRTHDEHVRAKEEVARERRG